MKAGSGGMRPGRGVRMRIQTDMVPPGLPRRMKALPIALALLLLLPLVPTVAAEPLPDLAPDPGPKDVYVPVHQECIWNGSWKVLVETPVYRIWYYSCDDPHS